MHQSARLRPGNRPGARARPVAVWTAIFSDELVRARRASATTSWRSPQRCATRPASARSPGSSPTASTTSASPSSTRSTSAAGLAIGRAAPGRRDLRDLPQPRVRPVADGRRAAPAAGHLRARPRRHHRRGRPEPQRHVGSGDPRRGAGPAHRRAARRADAARAAARGGRTADAGPTVVRFPKTPLGRDLPALREVGGVDVLAEPDPVRDGRRPGGRRGCGRLRRRRRRRGGAPGRLHRPRGRSAVGHAGFARVWSNFARDALLVVTVEDGVVTGGVGSRIAQTLHAAGVDVATREIGVPVRFLGPWQGPRRARRSRV